jgi:hypothetical protein
MKPVFPRCHMITTCPVSNITATRTLANHIKEYEGFEPPTTAPELTG